MVIERPGEVGVTPVGETTRTPGPVPPRMISAGGTEEGSRSEAWTARFKPVGGFRRTPRGTNAEAGLREVMRRALRARELGDPK
jgi:hypothetical protein